MAEEKTGGTSPLHLSPASTYTVLGTGAEVSSDCCRCVRAHCVGEEWKCEGSVNSCDGEIKGIMNNEEGIMRNREEQGGIMRN